MKYTVSYSSRFRKDLKLIAKRKDYDLDKLKIVVNKLLNGDILDESYKDHELHGKFIGYRECHIENDWLLVYKYKKEKLILVLIRTGTHSDLF